MSAAERNDMENQFMESARDAETSEDLMSKKGSVRTDKRGSRIISGIYKGLSPQEAEHMALTGQKPQRGKFFSGPLSEGGGLDGFYAMNPHLNPRRGQAESPASGVPVTSPTATLAPKVPKIGATMPTTGGIGTAAGGAVGATVAASTQQGLVPPTMDATAGMAQGLRDASQGVRERGPNSVTWTNGASITPNKDGSRTLVSPYGSGSTPALKVPSLSPSPPAAVGPTVAAPAPRPAVSPSLTPTAPRGATSTVTAAPQQPAMPQLPLQERMNKIITAGVGSPITTVNAGLAPAIPSLQVPKLGAFPQQPASDPGFTQAQRALDTASATPGPLAVAKGLGSVAADAAGAAASAATSVGGAIRKTAETTGNWLFGDAEAKKRLTTGTPRPPAIRQPAIAFQ